MLLLCHSLDSCTNVSVQRLMSLYSALGSDTCEWRQQLQAICAFSRAYVSDSDVMATSTKLR